MFQIINLCLNVLHFVLCFFYKSILSNLKRSADEGSHLLSPEASIFLLPSPIFILQITEAISLIITL